MTEFAIYGGVDHRNTVGKVAPGLFAQEGRCWRMIYENPVGQSGHCPEPAACVGRWKFLKGWTTVWSCERHADELPWALGGLSETTSWLDPGRHVMLSSGSIFTLVGIGTHMPGGKTPRITRIPWAK